MLHVRVGHCSLQEECGAVVREVFGQDVSLRRPKRKPKRTGFENSMSSEMVVGSTMEATTSVAIHALEFLESSCLLREFRVRHDVTK